MDKTTGSINFESQRKAPLPNFRDWVPDKARIVLYLVFLCMFQFTNGIYFTAFPQMQEALSLTMEDVSLLGQTVLAGLTFYFPIAFRLKFRFPNKWNLFAAAGIQMICNIVFPYLESMPAMIAICYLGGLCRLYGTFECFSNLLPRITPSYNYAVFLSFVFFVVIGFVNIFDIVSAHIIYYSGWETVHLVSAVLLAAGMAMILIFMKTFRPGPPQPMKGIDWAGMAAWSIFLMSAIYIAIYGNRLGWWQSGHIQAATAAALTCLAYGIWAMHGKKEPFIAREAFQMKHFWTIMGIFAVMDIMIAAQTVLQNTYCSECLGLGYLQNGNLRWPDFIGKAAGAAFCCMAMVRWHIGTRNLVSIAFCAITMYMAGMYANVTYGAGPAGLYLPIMLCGFGQIIIFIVLTTYVQRHADFTYYFQMICILGFIRTGVGVPAGNALIEMAMKPFIPREGLSGAIGELYGMEIILGISMLSAILLYRILGKANMRYQVQRS
ncbi:MAG: hypothetical protein NC335_05015 [Bacteroides sp.]|nr:hypothetical protein [Bacteroides sp.]